MSRHPSVYKKNNNDDDAYAMDGWLSMNDNHTIYSPRAPKVNN